MLIAGAGRSSAGELDQILRKNLLRGYPLSVLPPATRNTFATSTISIGPPALWFRTTGAALETNKVYESYIERAQAPSGFETGIEGPGATAMGDYKWKAYWQQRCQQVNPITTTGWVGFELGSLESNAIPVFGAGIGSPANGLMQLRQSLQDPTHWELVYAAGSGELGAAKGFVVPTLQGVPADAEGHYCQIAWDPFAPSVIAYVDGVERARITPADGINFQAWPWGNLAVGLVVVSGTQSAVSAINASFAGVNVVTEGTDGLGAGI